MHRRSPARRLRLRVLPCIGGTRFLRLRQVVGEDRPAGKRRKQRRIASQGIHRNPGIRRSPTPARIDQPHRNLLLGRNLPPKEVSDRGKPRRGLRRTRRPVRRDIVHRILTRPMLHQHQPYLRMIRPRDLRLAILHRRPRPKPLQRHLHIALPGSHPNIPNQHIRDRLRPFTPIAADRERIRPTRMLRLQPDRPLTQTIRRTRPHLPMQRNANLRPRTSPPPNPYRRLPLQHRVIR